MSNTKKMLALFLSLVMVIVALPLANFNSFASDSTDFSYEVISETDKTAELTGYSGNGGDVVIPSDINGYTVISLGETAFEEADTITSLTLPDSIQEVSPVALVGCTSATQFIVSANSQYFSTSDGVLFDKDKTQLIKYPCGKEDSTYTVPGTVSVIGPMAFALCGYLTEVTLPVNLEQIIDYAFAYCQSLESITIPNSVVYLGSYAFNYCSSLASVTLSESMQSIGENTFEGCSSLQSIYIPQSITEIGGYAFVECEGLTTVTGMEGVESLGDRVFVYCSSLSSVSLGSSLTSVGDVVFGACASLKSVTIPSSLSQIGEYMFESCSSLEEVVITEGVTSISSCAFRNCYNLTSITIPASVESIQSNAFDNSGLSTIYGYEGTCAQTFANEKGVTFVELLDPDAVLGDLDRSGSVDNTDFDIMMQAAVGSVNLTNTQKLLADINGDGVIDGFDVAALDRSVAENSNG